jgi:alginate O-acetyltransferase complex protein AlgI
MNVPSWQFLAFVLIGAAVFNAGSARWWRSAVWLVLNLAFVWSFSHAILPLAPLAGFLALGYGCLAAAGSGRTWAAPASIILVLAVFVWLKRYSFIPEALLLPPGAMTVGLSYIFFSDASGHRCRSGAGAAHRHSAIPEPHTEFPGVCFGTHPAA